MTFQSPSRRCLFWVFLVFTLIWFSNLDYRNLVRPDEGRYAEIPREMSVTGDWKTPRLNGIKYFEKPALQYWATAAAYDLFGEHHWTARLWSALTGFIGVLFTFYAGSRLFGKEAGLYSALVLGSSLLYAMIGHIITLDMGVSFFMGAGLMAFLLAQQSSATPRENKVWMLVTWAALALSILSKGLIGGVLPGAVLVLYTLIQRDFALWKRLHLISGLLLFFAITAPWFIAVSLANPEFFHFFFIHEHFERFLTKVHNRFHPWYTFIPILLLGILPWLVMLFDSLAHAWKKTDADKNTFQPKRFLLIWAVFIFVFFSVSSSKLPSYILPIFPALALLIGERLTQIKSRTLFWQIIPIAVLAAAGLVLIPKVISFASDEVPVALYQNYITWLYPAAAIWLTGSLIGLYLSYQERVRGAIIALALSSLIAGQLALAGHNSLSPASSAYHLAQEIKPYLKPDVPFYSVNMYEQTLPFYIKRTVTLVEYQDEMAFGIEQEPDKWIPLISTFEEIWRKQPYALAIMKPETFNRLQADHLPMQVIAKDTRRIIVKTP
ncbi:glycosyltransferase family 39 protein [Sulfurirhabdus autotrophica]|uniref:4-amino-4-deoxy-L-arabinose transferase-like glycosyltransferase n=1 Tax=Sulfurirhabdus autotrophica TaxID=1706046 RepID=A0A4R3YDB7_9PROT|nr:glycosyltransferase family 39 protein [Sulfurirhabdus autotrophica]TCV90097.1 4-amino-4-deoxy-L-arabinose transferase-like glycosyltransferase [Sulfurirhabdus autotrophica]